MTGVVLLNIVMLKLNDNDTPEQRTPNGNESTSNVKTVDEIMAVIIANKMMAQIIETSFPRPKI